MADRTQINIRVDNELVEAMKLRCEQEGSTQTEFIVAAIRAALGMPATESTDLNELVDTKLAVLEQRLSARIAALEEEQQRGKISRLRRGRERPAS